MKDFKIGQEVFYLSDEFVSMSKGVIIKKLENSNRWKIKFDFNELFSAGYEDKERIVEKLRKDISVFASFQEAHKKAMNIFDSEIKKIESHRKEFIERSQTLETKSEVKNE